MQAQQKNAAAIEQFIGALEKQPRAIEPLNMMVKTAMASGKSDVAIKELNKLIEIVPDHLTAYNFKGELYAGQQKYKPAISAFKKVVEIKPDWWIAHRNLAGTYRLSGQNDKAIADVEQNDKLIINLAAIYGGEGMAEKAIALYEEKVKAKPSSRMLANNLAMLLVEYRDDKASRNRALSLIARLTDQKVPDFLNTIGWVLFKNGDIDKALSALKEADKLAPNQPVILYHLGSVYYSKGDKSLARKYLQAVIDSGIKFKWSEKVQQMMDSINQQA